MTNIKKTWIICFAVLIASIFIVKCRSSKPTPPTPPATVVNKDTVIVAPVVVTAPIKTIEIPIEKKDTVVYERVTRVEPTGIDTALLYNYLDHYHGDRIQQITELQNTIATLNGTIRKLETRLFIKTQGEDSFKTKLDTSRQLVQAAKNVIAVNNKVLVDIPTIMFIIMTIIALCTVGVYRFTRFRLKQKGIDLAVKQPYVKSS